MCERTLSLTCILVFIALAHCSPCSADGLTASSLRLHLVLGTSFVPQAPNPMMPYGRLGRVAKFVTMLVVCAYLEYNAVVWNPAGWHTLCRYFW